MFLISSHDATATGPYLEWHCLLLPPSLNPLYPVGLFSLAGVGVEGLGGTRTQVGATHSSGHLGRQHLSGTVHHKQDTTRHLGWACGKLWGLPCPSQDLQQVNTSSYKQVMALNVTGEALNKLSTLGWNLFMVIFRTKRDKQARHTCPARSHMFWLVTQEESFPFSICMCEWFSKMKHLCTFSLKKNNPFFKPLKCL